MKIYTSWQIHRDKTGKRNGSDTDIFCMSRREPGKTVGLSFIR